MVRRIRPLRLRFYRFLLESVPGMGTSSSSGAPHPALAPAVAGPAARYAAAAAAPTGGAGVCVPVKASPGVSSSTVSRSSRPQQQSSWTSSSPLPHGGRRIPPASLQGSGKVGAARPEAEMLFDTSRPRTGREAVRAALSAQGAPSGPLPPELDKSADFPQEVEAEDTDGCVTWVPQRPLSARPASAQRPSPAQRNRSRTLAATAGWDSGFAERPSAMARALPQTTSSGYSGYAAATSPVTPRLESEMQAARLEARRLRAELAATRACRAHAAASAELAAQSMQQQQQLRPSTAPDTAEQAPEASPEAGTGGLSGGLSGGLTSVVAEDRSFRPPPWAILPGQSSRPEVQAPPADLHAPGGSNPGDLTEPSRGREPAQVTSAATDGDLYERVPSSARSRSSTPPRGTARSRSSTPRRQRGSGSGHDLDLPSHPKSWAWEQEQVASAAAGASAIPVGASFTGHAQCQDEAQMRARSPSGWRCSP